MYHAFQTTLTLDDLLDLLEIDEVGRSWRDAVNANLETEQRSKKRVGNR